MGKNNVKVRFAKNKGTADAMYLLRAIIVRSLEVCKDLYICFIDCTKDFDCVKPVTIIKVAADIQIDEKGIRLLKTFYWKQHFGIQIDINQERYAIGM